MSIWYDLSDVKLAEALDDRASFRRFCGFSANEGTPECTAFVRYRRLLVAQKLDRSLFETVTAQLKSKAVTVAAAPCMRSLRSVSHGEHILTLPC
ncbi:transposase [Sphingobium sp. AS12]|uniref:transposase n=1 Tax=Sphingobium sp. AS12 TaxID=2849495 RepID=UPI001C31E45F|nr:transposase [Sphingobium sp. AS12]MBV2148018.1 transposase [Sphingobium sp. AS12]